MKKYSLIMILAGLAMIGPLGIDTYLPSFHAIGTVFSVEQLVVQQTLSVFMIGFAFMMLFYGTLSDSFGRRPVLLVSLIIFTLTSFAAAFAINIEMLIITRFIQGLSAGAGSVIGRAIIQDVYKGRDAQKAMAQVMMIFGAAPALAPVIGGWLQNIFGWRFIFVFLTFCALSLLIACYLKLPESLPRDKFQPFKLSHIAKNYGRVISDTRFMLMCLSIGCVMTGISLYIGSAASFVMVILQLPETAFAWLFLPLIGGSFLGSSLVGPLSSRFSAKQMIRLGLTLSVSATIISVIYTSTCTVKLPYAVMPLALYTFGVSTALPAMILLTMQRFPDIRGLAASLQGFIQMAIFAIMVGVVAPFVFDSAQKIAIAHVIGMSLGVFFWLIARKNVACEHAV